MSNIQTMSTLIGKGPKFPFEPTPSKGVSLSQFIERINQSLFILFETPKGSRLMMPSFGSDLYKYRFDPYDNILIAKIRETILQDVKKWEPRVIIDSIDFLDSPQARDNHILYVTIDYHIINSEVSGNFVYPYKRNPYDVYVEE